MPSWLYHQHYPLKLETSNSPGAQFRKLGKLKAWKPWVPFLAVLVPCSQGLWSSQPWPCPVQLMHVLTLPKPYGAQETDRNIWEGSTVLQPHSKGPLWPHFNREVRTNSLKLTDGPAGPREEIIPLTAFARRNLGENWRARTSWAAWKCWTEGVWRQPQHQLIRCIPSSSTLAYTNLFLHFLCYLHFRTLPKRFRALPTLMFACQGKKFDCWLAKGCS